MTTDRCYRPRLSVEEAVLELRRCAASQFAPRLVAALEQIVVQRHHNLDPPPPPGLPGEVEPRHPELVA